MKSIGIYPGTFDPLHEGHVAFATAALSECRLDVVCLLPEPKPRLKTNVAAFDVRLNEVREGTATILGLDVIAIESDRFTVERTLPEVEALLGPARFTLLVGSDVARHVASWPEVEALLSRWQLAIGMRNDDISEDIEAIFYGIEQEYGISVKRAYVRTNKSTVSSSQLRRKLK